MLCCAVLCCAVLCCAVLCCAVLCCAVLCCAVLLSIFLPYIAVKSFLLFFALISYNIFCLIIYCYNQRTSKFIFSILFLHLSVNKTYTCCFFCLFIILFSFIAVIKTKIIILTLFFVIEHIRKNAV